MSATNGLETALLALYFNATAIANIADNAASTPVTNIQISLHTADPGETGSQTTSEATYTGYARMAVARTAGGWTISGNAFSNTAAITFAQCTAGSNSITHFGVGRSSSGAGTLDFKGALTAPLAVSAGITPSFAIGQLSGTAD